MILKTERYHLLWLIVIVAVTRGAMMISYPLGGVDDDQSAQRNLINQLLAGHYDIGNLRYNTGYPLFIFPVAAFGRLFGRLDDRLILLIQSMFAAIIPLLLYDILRVRRTPREAFVVAAVVALDPFGIQWANKTLPVWLVAWSICFALWLAHYALRTYGRRQLVLVAIAGFTIGAATLARTESAIAGAALGGALLLARELTWWNRVRLVAVLGGGAVVILAAYAIVIHQPSTGTWRLSCMSGIDLMFSSGDKDIPITPDNGSESRRLLELLAIEPLEPVVFSSGDYPKWRMPGPWATPEQQMEFLSRRTDQPLPRLDIAFPGTLVYYYGLCPTDDLLSGVYRESFLATPGRWITGIVKTTAQIIVHSPSGCCDDFYLPPTDLLSLKLTSNRVANTLGFRQAVVSEREDYRGDRPPFNPGGEYYTGQIVWTPGMKVFEFIFPTAVKVFWLMPLALLWAIGSRQWIYWAITLMFVSAAVVIAIFNVAQPRIYASVYPLSAALLGGFLAACLRRLLHRISRTQRG